MLVGFRLLLRARLLLGVRTSTKHIWRKKKHYSNGTKRHYFWEPPTPEKKTNFETLTQTHQLKYKPDLRKAQ